MEKNFQYVKVNFRDKFSFETNSIYAFDSLEKKIIYDNNMTNLFSIKKKREAIIDINSGLIIGTEDFMNYIEDIYFKELIEKNICYKELVQLGSYDEIGHNNQEYYLFNCYELLIKGKDGKRFDSINYYDKFPKIIFNSLNLGNNFEFDNDDLFKSVFNKLYFLIVCKNNNTTKDNENDMWYLGQPFFKKYPFSIDYDSKTIGFYFRKEEKYSKNKIQIGENNKRIKNVIKIITIIILSIYALFIAYYIGLKAKERRRKRANEMKDDDYEYIPEITKDINNVNNRYKEKKIFELNSKI